MIIAGKYSVGRKLGCGAFGDVHLGTDVATGKEVAIKLEPTSAETQQLPHEADVYRKSLKGGRGIANTFWSGVDGDFNVLVMEVLGPSLQDMFVFCGNRFSLKTVLLVVDQILSRLEHVHDQGFVHMDVKPDNFLVGLGDQRDTIYVIDFGLTKRFRDTTGRHLPCRTDQKLTGTARYASLNTHHGIERSRRDDLESLGYVLVYFLRGDLPWQGVKARTKKEKYDLIMHCKRTTSIEDLCKGLPPEFQWYLQYCRGLMFEETPNYLQMKRVFKELLYREGLAGDLEFDWTLKRHRMSQDRRHRQKHQPHDQQNQLQQRCPDDASGRTENLGGHRCNDGGASATESDVDMKHPLSSGVDERNERPPASSDSAAADPSAAEGPTVLPVGAERESSPPRPERNDAPHRASPHAVPTVATSTRSPSAEIINPPRGEHLGLEAKKELSRAREQPVVRRRRHEDDYGREEMRLGGGTSRAAVGGPTLNEFVQGVGGVGPRALSAAPIRVSAPMIDRSAQREPATISPLAFPPFFTPPPSSSGFPLIRSSGSPPPCSSLPFMRHGGWAGEMGGHLISPARRPSSCTGSGSGSNGIGSGSGGENGSGSRSGSGSGSVWRHGSGNGNGSGSGENESGNGSGSRIDRLVSEGSGSGSASGNGSTSGNGSANANASGSGSSSADGRASGSARGSNSDSNSGGNSGSNNGSNSDRNSGSNRGDHGRGNDSGSNNGSAHGSGSGSASGSAGGSASTSRGKAKASGIDDESDVAIQSPPMHPNPYRVGEIVDASHEEAMESNDEAIKAAIAEFQAPPGRRRVPVPAPRCGRSLLYMYGVITEDDVPKPDPKKMQFHCLASSQCRHASNAGTGGPIPIQKKATGNGTRHLKTVHNVESVKTRNERDRRGSLLGLQGPEVLVDEQLRASPSRPFFPSGSLDAAQQQQQSITPTTELEASAKPPERHQFAQLPFTAAPHPRPYPPPPPPMRSNPHPHPHFQFSFPSQGLPAPPPPLPAPVGMARNARPNSPPRSLPLLSLPTQPEGTPYNSPRPIQTHPGFRANGPPSTAAATVSAAAAREMALSFVKLFLVSHLRGFDVAEDPAVRDFLTACATPGFPRDQLTADDLRHYLFELYAATKMALVVDMHDRPDEALVAHAGVRHPGGIRGGTHGITPDPQRRAGSSFHASFELLNTATYDGGIGGEGEGSGFDGVISGSNTVQGEKYLCLRVHWLTQTFALRTASLAVRRWPRPILYPIDLESGRVGFGDGGLSGGEGVGLSRWTRDVLEEHGVEIGRLFSTVTDVEGENGCHGGAGPAVGRKRRGRSSASGRVFARMSSAGVSWEWSIAHMLDTVLAETFCISSSRCADGERVNTGARGIINCFQVLVTDLANDSTTCGCKTTFRGVRLATHGAYANRSNAFPFCWVTTMRVMEHTLASWTDLEEHYTHHRRSTTSEAGGGATTSTARFPLANHRALVEELYSVMKPVAAVIERTQERSPPPTTGPTSITSLVDLATLRLTTAEPSKPLLVFLPHKVATAASTTAAAGNVDAARVETRTFGESGACSITKVTRSVTDLNAATMTTRELLRVALDKHFFGARYDENYKKREGQGTGGGPSSSTENGLSGAGTPTSGEVDYVFEMASCMDPFLSQLFLVDSLASSPEYAARVKSIIWEKVVALAVSLAEAEEASTRSSEIHRRYDLGGRFLPREPQQNGARGVAKSGAGDGGFDRQPIPTSCYQGHPALEGDGKKRSRLTAFGSYKGVHNSIHNGAHNGGGGSSSAGDARGALPEPSPREDGASNGRNFDVSYILESGLFSSAPTNPPAGATTHKERAEAELEAFKALGAKRTFGVPPLKDLLPYWASEGAKEFPNLARAARVLLAFPTSSLVGENEELRGAEDRLLGRQGGTSPGSPGSVLVVGAGASSISGSSTRVGGIGGIVGVGAGSVDGSLPRFSDQGYAEMALLLYCNRGGIPRQIPALGPKEALANAPRRWLERPGEDEIVYKRI